MSKHTPQWRIAKSAIAIGAIIAGGFSLYASIEINPATSLPWFMGLKLFTLPRKHQSVHLVTRQ